MVRDPGIRDPGIRDPGIGIHMQNIIASSCAYFVGAEAKKTLQGERIKFRRIVEKTLREE